MNKVQHLEKLGEKTVKNIKQTLKYKWFLHCLCHNCLYVLTSYLNLVAQTYKYRHIELPLEH